MERTISQFSYTYKLCSILFFNSITSHIASDHQEKASQREREAVLKCYYDALLSSTNGSFSLEKQRRVVVQYNTSETFFVQVFVHLVDLLNRASFFSKKKLRRNANQKNSENIIVYNKQYNSFLRF